MKPPSVEEVTSHTSHNTNTITKIVQSMWVSLRRWMQGGSRTSADVSQA
jgi:hypothetical protein